VRFGTTTYRTLVASYVATGKIRFALRHLPLERIHPWAFMAAEVAECSGQQGKFWQTHDALFSGLTVSEAGSLSEHRRALGLDAGRFHLCMNRDAAARVRDDIREAQSLEITGTPTFLFGRIEPDGRLRVVRRESGAIPADVFVAVLDQLLKPIARPTP
jgi:protein-disulfide isomerase